MFRGATSILHCPHRLTQWSLATRDLLLRARPSGPAAHALITREAGYYFSPAARGRMLAWLNSVGIVIASCQLAVLELYKKALYNNLQNLKKKQKETNGMINK